MAQRAFPIRRARNVVPGGSTSPGNAGVLISCSADGWVRLNLTSGDYIDVYAQAGTSALADIHCNGVASASAFTPLATNVVVNVCDY
jgi:hypothetical protein